MTAPAELGEIIVADAAVLAGKPIIKGTRLSVDFVLGLLADGWDEKMISENYPGVSGPEIRACLADARDLVQEQRVWPTIDPAPNRSEAS